jgi:thiamine phosphate synthase YjbQ (UPF0047 family)
MRAFTITNTPVDLMVKDLPFAPGNTVVFQNFTAGALTVQEADTSGGSYTTLQVVPAGSSVEKVLNKQFIQVSTAANVQVLQN